ncbi:uncharacterized protein LOC128861321 [Anastrepha ludens]|uniref:uncharacterized protein LOC128861321 n=1 Tax=Anastrepha ludens TaxID=28586 RepID=UPI0023AEEFB9|nr:uncharacterized protein LOC128861321 [Anastrepha ludens]
MAECVMKNRLSVILQVIFCLCLFIDSTSAACNVCQTNQVACINSTSFYLCFGESDPNMDTLYHCKEGFECTEYTAICLQASATRAPSCGSTSLCGQCTAQSNALFACMSRSTFQMCYGGLHPTGQLGYCPSGFVCDATSDAVCVSEAASPTVTCDVVDPTMSTTSSTTTSSTTTTSASSTSSSSTTESSTTTRPLTPNEVCAQKTTTGLYPTVPEDPYCKRYIHCRRSNGVMSGIEYTCATSTYYNVEKAVCTIYKPANCI